MDLGIVKKRCKIMQSSKEVCKIIKPSDFLTDNGKKGVKIQNLFAFFVNGK